MLDTPRILIIDDDDDIVKLAKIMLSYMGYEVKATTDNLGVFDILNESHYDLILLDIQMPHMNGFEVCSKIRQGPFKDIKIILFTASADADVLNRGMIAGANYVLSKPFSIEKIKETVRKTLESNEPLPYNGEQFTQVYTH